MVVSIIGLIMAMFVLLVGVAINVNDHMSPQSESPWSAIFMAAGLLFTIGFAIEIITRLV